MNLPLNGERLLNKARSDLTRKTSAATIIREAMDTYPPNFFGTDSDLEDEDRIDQARAVDPSQGHGGNTKQRKDPLLDSVLAVINK